MAVASLSRSLPLIKEIYYNVTINYRLLYRHFLRATCYVICFGPSRETRQLDVFPFSSFLVITINVVSYFMEFEKEEQSKLISSRTVASYFLYSIGAISSWCNYLYRKKVHRSRNASSAQGGSKKQRLHR